MVLSVTLNTEHLNSASGRSLQFCDLRRLKSSTFLPATEGNFCAHTPTPPRPPCLFLHTSDVLRLRHPSSHHVPTHTDTQITAQVRVWASTTPHHTTPQPRLPPAHQTVSLTARPRSQRGGHKCFCFAIPAHGSPDRRTGWFAVRWVSIANCWGLRDWSKRITVTMDN